MVWWRTRRKGQQDLTTAGPPIPRGRGPFSTPSQTPSVCPGHGLVAYTSAQIPGGLQPRKPRFVFAETEPPGGPGPQPGGRQLRVLLFAGSAPRENCGVGKAWRQMPPQPAVGDKHVPSSDCRELEGKIKGEGEQHITFSDIIHDNKPPMSLHPHKS